MADDSAQVSMKRGNVLVQQGQPVQFTEIAVEDGTNSPASSLLATVGESLRAYARAARKLLAEKYASQKDLVPLHMREPCNMLVLRCSDGLLVRYDAAAGGTARLRCGKVDATLAEMSPQFSDQVIHFPQDPQTYTPSGDGPEIVLSKVDAAGNAMVLSKLRFLIFASTTFPAEFQLPAPPSRPPCFVSLHNELDLEFHGLIMSAHSTEKSVQPPSERFVAHSRFKLPVGWQAIEIYPILADEYWKPELAAMWAELDILAVIAQRNAIAASLHALDGRADARRQYAVLFAELEKLLTGPEEPAHQFLKQHPEILSPTHDRVWSKLPFGDRVSDFVFREAYNDYELVEIEAPYRALFRKDGQQREELTHAINQITDWIQYITDNKRKVEEELGLTGISTNPRTLVVIGRSACLTAEDRRKLSILQAQQNKLRILTYDDLIVNARANIERILGPLSMQANNVEFYYYTEPRP